MNDPDPDGLVTLTRSAPPGPHSPGPSLPKGERGEKPRIRDVFSFPLLSLWERRGRGGEGLTLAVLLLFCSLPVFAQSPAADSNPTLWPEPQRAFFQDGPALLLSPQERETLRGLDEAGRERFIRDFLDRDPLPETQENELRAGIERRQRLVAHELPSPQDARAQLLFLRGRPAKRLVLDCAAAFKPLEIWSYPGPNGVPEELILYRPSAGEPFRLWLPIDSKRALYTSEMEFWLFQWDEAPPGKKRIDRFFCPDSERVDRVTGVDGLGNGPAPDSAAAADLARAAAGAGSPPTTGRDFRWVRPENRIVLLWRPADLASWARAAAATPLPSEVARLEMGGLDLDFPSRQGQRLLARVLTTLPASAGVTPTAELNGPPRVRLAVDGVVEREGEVFEDFRLRYRLPLPAGEAPLALLLERALRPGQSFVIRLRIKDETSGAEATVSRGFRVPDRPERHLPAELTAKALGGEMLRPGGVTGPDTLLLVPPPSEIVLSVWRAEAVVTGDHIAKVVFLLDGQPQLARTRPPYSAEMRLAEIPREQVVRVEGYDDAGGLVAWDQVVLNQARGKLRVLITDPPRGRRVAGKVQVRAEVVVPEERRVESVELRVNDRRVATLTAPPWQREIEVPAAGDLAYLTVTARLDDGSQAEDVRFLRAPANLGEVEVDLVELFATVLDGSGHPVRGLPASDFEVLEAGKPQKIARFEQVDNLPLTLGVAIDTSFSMASSLHEAERAAAGFVHNLLEEKDRCFALGFSSRPTLLLPPVDDPDAVAMSLEGLRAFGRTALYDAIITSLYYFRAERGQRALVLLTDGDDTFSSTSWEDALSYARASGVAIYPIGLGLSEIKRGPRSRLMELADATGGRAFFIDRAEELAGAYSRIEEELRSRYLIAYNSDRPADASGVRPIEVRVKRGLRARVSRGAYP
jgi:Ca-activated chloride channel homolog